MATLFRSTLAGLKSSMARKKNVSIKDLLHNLTNKSELTFERMERGPRIVARLEAGSQLQLPDFAAQIQPLVHIATRVGDVACSIEFSPQAALKLRSYGNSWTLRHVHIRVS